MNKISQEHIDEMITQSFINYSKIGEKTAIACATLPNGFEIITYSSCIDPENYDQEVGNEICHRKIEEKLWELEGYLLQERLDDF